MNETFEGDFNATQTGAAGAASEQKTEGVCPVFVKQLLDSTESTFQMFGMHFSIVTLAAIVRSIESSSTKISYELEDHTGRIEAHYWLEDGDESGDAAPNIMINNYAKVFGCVRPQGGQRTLMIFKMYPITSPNEVSTHALEALFSRFKSEEIFTKSSTNGDFNMMETGTFSVQSNTSTGLEAKHRTVFDAIREFNTADGISRMELQNKFKHIKPEELNKILDFLVSEGHAYSSVDPDHFLSTE